MCLYYLSIETTNTFICADHYNRSWAYVTFITWCNDDTSSKSITSYTTNWWRKLSYSTPRTRSQDRYFNTVVFWKINIRLTSIFLLLDNNALDNSSSTLYNNLSMHIYLFSYISHFHRLNSLLIYTWNILQQKHYRTCTRCHIFTTTIYFFITSQYQCSTHSTLPTNLNFGDIKIKNTRYGTDFRYPYNSINWSRTTSIMIQLPSRLSNLNQWFSVSNQRK